MGFRRVLQLVPDLVNDQALLLSFHLAQSRLFLRRQALGLAQLDLLQDLRVGLGSDLVEELVPVAGEGAGGGFVLALIMGHELARLAALETLLLGVECLAAPQALLEAFD